MNNQNVEKIINDSLSNIDFTQPEYVYKKFNTSYANFLKVAELHNSYRIVYASKFFDLLVMTLIMFISTLIKASLIKTIFIMIGAQFFFVVISFLGKYFISSIEVVKHIELQTELKKLPKNSENK
jgi:hypothetical protein